MCLTTDIIAGFCEESEEEHQDSLSLMREVAFDQAFMFAYSLRDRTHAGPINSPPLNLILPNALPARLSLRLDSFPCLFLCDECVMNVSFCLSVCAAHSETMSDSVPEEVKQRRLKEIIEVYRDALVRRNVRTEGGRLRLVLVEGLSTRSEKQLGLRAGQGDYLARVRAALAEGMQLTLTGRTDGNKRVVFPASNVLSSLGVEDCLAWRRREEHQNGQEPLGQTEGACDLAEWLRVGRGEGPFLSIAAAVESCSLMLLSFR